MTNDVRQHHFHKQKIYLLRIFPINPASISVIVADYLESSTIVRDAVGITNGVGVRLQRSTKLHNYPEIVNMEHPSSGGHIRPLCPTRVFRRGKGIGALLTNLESVLSALISE